MAKFTTRVELHSATYSDYEKLHTAMEAEGFSRLIKSDDGTWYHLLTAVYNREDQLTRDQVLESAKRASAKTGKSYAILVTEATARTWVGLKQHQKS